jgi:ribosomal protein L1
MVKIGLREFDEAAIFQNFDALARALVTKKPESIKGNHLIYHILKLTV